MADIFRRAQIVVSPAFTMAQPNSPARRHGLRMFSIAGNLDSIREWITNDRMAYSSMQIDPQKLADAILEGLKK